MGILVYVFLIVYIVLVVFLIMGNVAMTKYVWTEKGAGAERGQMRALNIFLWVLLPLTGSYAVIGLLYGFIYGQDIITGVK